MHSSMSFSTLSEKFFVKPVPLYFSVESLTITSRNSNLHNEFIGVSGPVISKPGSRRLTLVAVKALSTAAILTSLSGI